MRASIALVERNWGHARPAAILLLLVLGGQAPGQQEMLTGSATVDIDETISPAVIGGGVNFAFSDYNYIHFRTGGEWGEIHSQHLSYPDDGEEWTSFKRLMDYAGFQYVRLEVGVTEWEPVNDDGDPHWSQPCPTRGRGPTGTARTAATRRRWRCL